MEPLPFLKMHGLGNDFVVLDARERPIALTETAVRAIADRRLGVGFDQLIVMEPSADGADLFMRIRNADGGEVSACGNASRCVASLVMAEKGARTAWIDTASGLLECAADERGVTVDMGPARLDWRDIPTAEACDTLSMPVSLDGLADPVGVNMGNPHAVFFVPDAEAVALERVGPALETHPFFPQRANIEMVHALGLNRLRMRVWERGVGITHACGTGACAVAVAAVRQGLTGRAVEVVLDGGSLDILWREEDGHVLMTGPVATSFRGVLSQDLL